MSLPLLGYEDDILKLSKATNLQNVIAKCKAVLSKRNIDEEFK